MLAVFSKILYMSLEGSWLILLILLLRIPAGRAGKWVPPLLWGAAGVRLLFPFTLETVWSLKPAWRILQRETVTGLLPAGAAPAGSPGNLPAAGGLAGTLPHGTADTAGFLFSPWMVLSVIWFLGVILFIGYGLFCAGKLHRQHRVYLTEEKGIRVADTVTAPFLTGIFRPVIYLPSWLEGEEKDYVLRHEKAHIQRRDPLWKTLAYGILALHWFNPLIWAAYVLFCRDLEMACDEKVITERFRQERTDGADSGSGHEVFAPMTLEERKAYASVLVDCSQGTRPSVVAPLTFAEVSVKARVRMILQFKRTSLWLTGLVLLLCGTITAGAMTDPVSREIRDALSGAMLTQMEFSKLETPNGTTAALSEEELERMIAQYAEKVDRYYTADNGCQVYKQQYADLLRRVFQEPQEEALVQCGTVDCRITSLRYVEGGTQAELTGSFTGWAVFVCRDEDSGKYRIAGTTSDRTDLRCRMEKENGVWKVKEMPEFLPSEETGKSSALQRLRRTLREEVSLQRLEQKLEKLEEQEFPDYAGAWQAIHMGMQSKIRKEEDKRYGTQTANRYPGI